jgi:hypothetical protein
MASSAQGLKGEWTYRSFVNEPKPVGGDAQTALGLIFGEGALTVSQADSGGFKAALSFGGKAVMDLVGSFRPAAAGAPAVIAARGTGRKGSGIEDFVYDYIFYPVAAWPGGIDQRQAMVGTVMRAADHGSAKKGAVVSAIAVRRGAKPAG